jgi:hypothetical protein
LCQRPTDCEGSQETVEKVQTVLLRGVLGVDVGVGARRGNLDLPAPNADAQIASSSLPFPSLIPLTPRNDNFQVFRQSHHGLAIAIEIMKLLSSGSLPVGYQQYIAIPMAEFYHMLQEIVA